jgi:polyferredoxin
LSVKKSIKRLIRPRNLWARKLVQAFFFVLIALIAVNHHLAESGGEIPFLSNASLHAICPFGGVVSLYQFSTIGTFTQKIHQSSFVLMVIVFLSVFLVGPAFCGWVCPLGTIQDWVRKIGKKLFRRRYNYFVPIQLDRILRYLRYFILAWVLYMAGYSGKLIFAENQEQINCIEGHVIAIPISTTPEPVQVQTEVVHNPESSNDRMINGITTFREVIDWGIQ